MLVHHFTKWLAGDVAAIIPGWDGFVVTDLAAPAFTIAAGASAVLYAVLKRPSVSRIVRRYGMLVPTGMLIQWLFTSHVPFDWGVLQALGVAVVVSTLLAIAIESPAVMAAIATGALVAGPVIEAAADGHAGRLADILGGVFPIVTYTGFALLGATGGLLLLRKRERGGEALALGIAFAGASLVLLALDMPPDRYPGGVAFVIPGIAGTLLLFGVLDRWRAVPDALGNHTLGIFLSHYAVCWAITESGWRHALTPTNALFVSFVAVLVFALVAPRVPTLPWSPRTGWARTSRWAPQNRLASSAA